MQDSRCDYFQWYDTEFRGRNAEVITHLNNRKIYLEAKIELLEEKIVMLEEKVAKKKEKNREKKVKFGKYWKILKIFGFVTVVFIAVLVMKSQQKKNVNGGWLYVM